MPNRNLPSPKPKLRPKDEFRRLVAERLKDARKAAQLSQSQAGKLFDPEISKASVAQWESTTAGTLPSVDRLLVLARGYKVTLEQILGEKPLPIAGERLGHYVAATGLSEDAIEIARAWDALNDFHKDTYRALIFYDAMLTHRLPSWFKWGRPKSPSYDEFEESVENDASNHRQQLKLRF